jgi:endo-1,4-beta-xylanase
MLLKKHGVLALTILLAVVAAGVLINISSPAGRANQPALKDIFKHDFLIGAALNPNQFTERDARGLPIIISQFNSITPENVLKWEVVHPQPGTFNFENSDAYVAFGEKYHMFIIGHTLIWHSQTPRWVFEDDKHNPVDRDTLLARMREHISTVVGRYKGRIKGWDVVNEALNDDGTLRQSPWLKIIGEDYLVKAFQFAREADPRAQLYYNDYSLENEPKRKGAIELIRKLKAAGIPIYAVGLQGHDKLDWPTAEQEDRTIADFAGLGIKVNITELDIDVLPRANRSQGADVAMTAQARQDLNPFANGLPDTVQQNLARQYAELFRVFLKHHEVIDRVTFWGVTDGDSWLNNWPVRGRTSYPLLFDRAGRTKSAFDAVVQTAQ